METVTGVGIIIGSTRPGRIGLGVARWVHEVAQRRSDAHYELVDIADYNLPLLDEPEPPSTGNYRNEHTKRWSAKVASLDAFVFVTPEYNHGTSAALKNALDFLYAEWNNKAAAVVLFRGTSSLGTDPLGFDQIGGVLGPGGTWNHIIATAGPFGSCFQIKVVQALLDNGFTVIQPAAHYQLGIGYF